MNMKAQPEEDREWSLSARRAWIEIESRITEDLEFDCRSPQGERG